MILWKKASVFLHIELFLGWAPRSCCVSVEPWTRQKILVLTTTPSPRCRCLLQTAAAMPSRRYLSTGNSWSNHRAASCMHTEWNGAISSKFSWRGNKWPELGSIRESARTKADKSASFLSCWTEGISKATLRNGIEFPRGSTVVNPSVRKSTTLDRDGPRITRAKNLGGE